MKYKALMNSVPLAHDRVYRGEDTQPCSPTIHFVVYIFCNVFLAIFFGNVRLTLLELNADP